MEDKQIIRYEYTKGKKRISPCNRLVDNWVFNENEEKIAILAHHIAEVAQENGLDANDMHHLVPCILRILKCKTEWAG